MNTLQTMRAAADMLAARLLTAPPKVAAAAHGEFDHSEWEALLRAHVSGGHVDYAGFDRPRLDAYLARLADADPEALGPAAQLTFWINAYNALVVWEVLEREGLRSVLDAPDFFNQPHRVGRRTLTLNQIEHGIIRRFGDPRVHAALVCAAGSCPALRAYDGDHLAAQLESGMRSFMDDPARGVRYDATTDTVEISTIFRWFAGDFGGAGAYLEPRRILPALRPYLSREMLRAAEAGRIRWMAYDWGLNGVER